MVVVLQHSSMKVEKNPVGNSQREHLQVITITSIWNVFIAQPKSQPGSLIRHERCFSLGIYLKCRTDRMCFTFIYLIRHFGHMESFCLNLKSSYMLSHRTFYVLSSRIHQSLHQGYSVNDIWYWNLHFTDDKTDSVFGRPKGGKRFALYIDCQLWVFV